MKKSKTRNSGQISQQKRKAATKGVDISSGASAGVDVLKDIVNHLPVNAKIWLANVCDQAADEGSFCDDEMARTECELAGLLTLKGKRLIFTDGVMELIYSDGYLREFLQAEVAIKNLPAMSDTEILNFLDKQRLPYSRPPMRAVTGHEWKIHSNSWLIGNIRDAVRIAASDLKLPGSKARA